MKLFYWDDVQALKGWTPGHCIALAETKGQAIDLILESFRMVYGETETTSALRRELASTTPYESDQPSAFYIWGSD